MSKAWAKGSTRRWRRVRALVLANNQATHGGGCRLAIDGVCTGQADTVHHTLGRAATGDDWRYLEATCAPCNLHVGNPTTHNPKPLKITSW